MIETIIKNAAYHLIKKISDEIPIKTELQNVARIRHSVFAGIGVALSCIIPPI